jgi:hypothetical protein
MSPLSLVKYQMALQIVAPNFAWWVCARRFGSFSFPVSNVEIAFDCFPKLRYEHATITDVYSSAEATQYVLAYANSFIFGSAIFFSSIGFFVMKTKRVASLFDTAHSTLTGIALDSDIKEIELSGSRKIKILVAYASVLIVLFFLPITYRPAAIVNAGKQLDAIYSFIALIIPVCFIAFFSHFIVLVRRR